MGRPALSVKDGPGKDRHQIPAGALCGTGEEGAERVSRFVPGDHTGDAKQVEDGG